MKTSTTIFNSTHKVQILNLGSSISADVPEHLESSELQVKSLTHALCKLKREMNDIEDALYGGNYCKAQRELYDMATKAQALYIICLNYGLFVCPESRTEI